MNRFHLNTPEQIGKPRKRQVNAVETDSREILKSEKLEKKITRQADLEVSFEGGQGLISGYRAHRRRREGQNFISVKNWLRQWIKSQYVLKYH
jgi:hypothetical protein